MTRFASVFLVTVFAGIGCAPVAPAPGSAPGPSGTITPTETGSIIRLGEDSKAVSVTIGAPPDKVWAVLPAVYGRLGVATEISDGFARMIGTRTFTQSRLAGQRTLAWIRCGNQGAGPSSGGMYRTRLTITSTARASQEGRTDLVTEVTGTATPVEGTSTGTVSCSSTGDLEQRIRDLVLEELAR